MSLIVTRRRLLAGAAAGAGGLLAGCDALNDSAAFRGVLTSAEDANFIVQRAFSSRANLAREYDESDLSPIFRANGTRLPENEDYARLAAGDFADYRLEVRGRVERPYRVSLARLMSLPRRTQITRHDCVEGWSAIGKWTGTPLKILLDAARLKDDARYIVFRCADEISGTPYYESIDLIDAYHPQTIMAWGLNGKRLPVENGAPLRLRVERQLGYKHAKYVMAIEAVASLADLGGGKGGFWEDRSGYAWYAGI